MYKVLALTVLFFNSCLTPVADDKSEVMRVATSNTVKSAVPAGWKKVMENGFSFYIPPDMAKKEVQGVDSYVLSFRNETCALNVDYGEYSPITKNPTEIISGFKAEITVKDLVNELDGNRYEKVSSLEFEGPVHLEKKYLSMQVFGKTMRDQETAGIIFRSVNIEDEIRP